MMPLWAQVMLAVGGFMLAVALALGMITIQALKIRLEDALFDNKRLRTLIAAMNTNGEKKWNP